MYSIELDMVNINGIVYVPALENKTVLGVMREGVGYTEVSTAPDERQFRFTSSLGKLEFENLFVFGSGWVTELKKVQVLYK